MRNYFTLGGVDSRTYGVYISGQGTFDSPARSLAITAVPGRNGDIIGMETRLQNGTFTYKDAYIFKTFASNIEAFKALLLSAVGYRKLIDSYHPDEFRMVVYQGPLTVKPNDRNNAAKFDITFNAKPQRFLNSGESVTTLNATGTINNPTLFASKPLIRVYGNGVLGVGSDSITVSNNASNYMDIDCEAGLAYRGASNMNNSIMLSGFDFPELKGGTNNIALGTGISKVEITPRWWRV